MDRSIETRGSSRAFVAQALGDWLANMPPSPKVRYRFREKAQKPPKEQRQLAHKARSLAGQNKEV